MADSEAQKTAGESFSQLLFADANVGLDSDGCYNYNTSFSPENPPTMLCFGDIDCSLFNSDFQKSAPQDSQLACINLPKPDRKRNRSVDESASAAGAPADFPANRKRSERSNVTGHGKGKKEKLGERITALQQLVSPYGKTDTASVLHEAMGYIKFLQDQVQVLCSPYLQVGDSNGDGDQVRKDLRSMGLCLVPLECTSLVANDNGADFWSPAMSKNFSPN